MPTRGSAEAAHLSARCHAATQGDRYRLATHLRHTRCESRDPIAFLRLHVLPEIHHDCMQFPILNVLLENLRNCMTRRYDDDVLPDTTHAVTNDVITSDYLQVRTSRCKPQGRIAMFMPFAPRATCSHQLTWDWRNCKDSSHCEPTVRTPTNMDPVLEGKT